MSDAAFAFLCGGASPNGLTVDKILAMSNDELEDKHDWVQWAFPTHQLSRYNPSAPIISWDDAVRGYSPAARANLVKLTDRYLDFLMHTISWRHPHDHNHLRITRVITALRLARLTDKAQEVYAFAIRGTSYTTETGNFWADAMNGRLP